MNKRCDFGLILTTLPLCLQKHKSHPCPELGCAHSIAELSAGVQRPCTEQHAVRHAPQCGMSTSGPLLKTLIPVSLPLKTITAWIFFHLSSELRWDLFILVFPHFFSLLYWLKISFCFAVLLVTLLRSSPSFLPLAEGY